MPPEHQHPPPDITDERGTLAVSMPCVGCGYNLRGLPGASNCSECGRPIAASTNPALLRFAPRRILARMTLASLLLSFAALISVPLLYARNFFYLGFMARSSTQWISITIYGVIVFTLKAFIVWCVWQLTSPQVNAARGLPDTRARRTARYAAFAQLGVLPASHLKGYLESRHILEVGLSGVDDPDPVLLLAVVLVGMLSAVGIATTVALLLHLARLADHKPHPKLARRTRWVMWGYAMPAGMLLLLMMSEQIGDALAYDISPVPYLMPFGIITLGVLYVMIIVFGISGLVTLTLHSLMFRHAAGEARMISGART